MRKRKANIIKARGYRFSKSTQNLLKKLELRTEATQNDVVRKALELYEEHLDEIQSIVIRRMKEA